MRKSILFLAIAAASSQSMAAAYKIPEQSINSTALAGAYVANAHGSDASYYNPAAMAFNEGGASLEADITLIHLNSINFQNESPFSGDDSTKEEQFVIPTFHYASPAVGNARFGLSLVAPGGLSKRWKGVNRSFAEEFTLNTYEINPTVGYKINDQFSIGGGLRALFSSGKVVSSMFANRWVPVGRDMDGDSWDFGYNLALHYRPTQALNLAATYRSKIDLTIEGDATIGSVVPLPTLPYDGSAEVEIPLPAALNLAASYTFNEATTVELVYERTYWSSYKELDFNYDTSLDFFDAPSPKNWEDSNTFRIGVTHQLNPRWTLMGGYAHDETPVPKAYASYELPDSNANIFSVGARYQATDAFSIGAAFLYDTKDSLTIQPGESKLDAPLTVAGKFEDAAAYLLTMGVEYKF